VYPSSLTTQTNSPENEFSSRLDEGIGKAIVNRLLRGGGTVLTTANNFPRGCHIDQLIQADVSTRARADHVVQPTFDRAGGQFNEQGEV
jgi:NAD(P)-dependent dehydrogenase (short-subunit alcohol dehydrogenase family)